MDAPVSLVESQKKLASVVRNPTGEVSSRGFLIYRESYWGRLGNLLSIHYPSLPKHLGEDVWVEKIIRPYILDNPPKDWMLEAWALGFVDWLIQNKKEELSPLLIPLAIFERAHLEVFYSSFLPVPTQEELSTVRFFLQPHLRFFSTTFPLRLYRRELLKGEPPRELEESKQEWILLSLGKEGHVMLQEIEEEEKTLLEMFQGRSLEEVLSFAAEKDPLFIEKVSSKIGEWCFKWMKENLLGVNRAES